MRQAVQRIIDELGGPAEGIGLGGELAGIRSHMLYMGNLVPDDGLFESC
jgi:hypothetical protein